MKNQISDLGISLKLMLLHIAEQIQREGFNGVKRHSTEIVSVCEYADTPCIPDFVAIYAKIYKK